MKIADERTVCNSVTTEKDVDGFHVTNVGRLCLDIPSILPATPAGVWEMLQRSGETLTKQRCHAMWRPRKFGGASYFRTELILASYINSLRRNDTR